MPSSARLTVDLSALARNHAQLVRDAPGAEVAPVLKADGYGLGAGPVGRRLWDEGARSFFVARLSEGEALRTDLGDRDAAILVLDGLALGGAERLVAARLTPVLNSLPEIDDWAAAGDRHDPLPCALHIDTGMNRIGVDHEAAPEAARRIAAAAGLTLELVMSHLAVAAETDNPRNGEQLARLRTARALFPGVRASLAASAGVYLGRDYHFDQVRPGICLFGGGPHDEPDPRFAAVATLEAPVLQVRDIAAGEAVGYGRMFRAPRAMRIALVAAGYADGVMRGSFANGEAVLGGMRTPFAIVAMDMLAVDVSQAPGVKPGDMIQLLGPDVPLDDVAKAGGTVAHEILVRLSHRAERVYRS